MESKNQSHQRATAFISYAREDREFVRLLREGLKERGVEAWGDWLLTTGEDFARRLQELNLGAQAFLFVISPDSVKSDECLKELALAVKHKKQVLPISYRDHKDDNLLDSALRAPQWTLLREGDDLKRGMDDLAKAINTDFALTEMHGRLLVAADNWAGSGRNRSYLWRKDVLKSAESWLAETSAHPDKLPQPTPLEIEFIFAGQRARTSGVRWAFGLASSVALALALLSVVAVAQWRSAVRNADEAQRNAREARAQTLLAQKNEAEARSNAEEARRQKKQAEDNARKAEEQRKKADENAAEARRQQAEAEKQTEIAEGRRRQAVEQARIATSRQMAAETLSLLNNQLDLAMLLSVEAYRAYPTVEARGSLLAGLSYSPYLSAFLTGHKTTVSSLAFSPDGRLLASGDGSGRIIVWRLGKNRPLTEIKAGLSDVSFGPDSKTLAAAVGDRVALWDAETGRRLDVPFGPHEARVVCVQFGPDGKIASGDYKGNVYLWDSASGKLILGPLAGHKKPITALSFDARGKVLASGSDDKTIILWDVESGKALHPPLTGHKGQVLGLNFSPHAPLLMSVSGADDFALGWDVESGKNLGPKEFDGPVMSLAFSPVEEGLVAVGGWDNRVHLLSSIAAPPSLRGHKGSVWSIAFSPDGKRLASGSQDGSVILWDISPRLVGHTGYVRGVSFSADSRTLASAGEDKQLLLWDADGRRQSAPPLKDRDENFTSVAFSPDGRLLAAGEGDGTVGLWEAGTWAKLDYAPRLDGEAVMSVAFSSDGGLVAAGGLNGTVAMWDVRSRRMLPLPKEHEDAVWKVAFSSTGLLASSDRKGAVVLWDVAGRKKLARVEQPLTGEIQSLAFSPDGRLLAGGCHGRTIYFWDVTARSARLLRAVVTEQQGPVTSLAFTTDGKTLASGSVDGTVAFWDVGSYRELGRAATRHGGTVWGLAFSPDGKLMATGSSDKTVSLWDGDFDPTALSGRARRVANRPLNEQERSQYLARPSLLPPPELMRTHRRPTGGRDRPGGQRRGLGAQAGLPE